MTIEVASVPDPRRVISLRRLAHFIQCLFRDAVFGKRSLTFRYLVALLLLLSVVGGDALLRSFKYYSRIIDARLADGYLTSRPGLYAAPRSLQVGQKLSPEKVVNALREIT